MSFIPLSYSMRRITIIFVLFRGQKTLLPCNKAVAPLNFYLLDGETTIFLCQ